MRARNIDLIYIDSGGGHRAAANALCQVIRDQGLPWDVRMRSIQEMLASIDIIRKTSGVAFEDVYNIMLRRGWTAGSAHWIPLMHLVIRLMHGSEVRVLERQWHERPDLVVSLIPHFNRAIKAALDRAHPGVPYVTILTDIADYPPHFWLEPQDQYVIGGSERAVRQAADLGIPGDKIFRTSGMIVHPAFYQPFDCDRRVERRRLGLDPDLPTGLVLFGGEGSLELVEIARQLNRPASGVQLILLCGRHEHARRELQGMPRAIPMFVEGFTRQVPFYMELSDFFIGKPGPGSISEAIVKRLPILVRRDRRTLAHEAYNCDWIEEQGVGVVVSSYSGLFDAVREMVRPERLCRYRRRLAAMRNRAVYEIPGILDEILLRSGAAPSRSGPAGSETHLPLSR